MSKIDTLIKLAGKFKSDLRQQYKDSMGYPDAGEIARRKGMGEKSPREKINEAFNYIESSKNPDQARNRAEEMFGEFDIDGAIEEAGGFEKAFKTAPIKGVTRARESMLTPAQKRRARKTQKDLWPSARRDMKDVKPPVERSEGGPVSKIKEKSVSGQVKLLNKSRRSAEKTEKKLRSMGDELDLIKKTKKQLEKDYGTKTKKPVEKAKGGMASAAKTITSKTTRSRNKTKPRGVGVALRGYGKALK